LLAFTLPLSEPLVVEPAALLAFLATLVAVIFGLARWKPLGGFCKYCAPLIWTYFLPMICSSLGIIPSSSDLYGPFMGQIVLPMILVLLLVPCDTRSILRLGPKAVGMMLIGTLGIVAGAGLSFALLRGVLPAEIGGQWPATPAG
jgi:uncharacterized membrane protein